MPIFNSSFGAGVRQSGMWSSHRGCSTQSDSTCAGPGGLWALGVSRGVAWFDVQLRYWQVGVTPHCNPPSGKPEGKSLSGHSNLRGAVGTARGSGAQPRLVKKLTSL